MTGERCLERTSLCFFTFEFRGRFLVFKSAGVNSAWLWKKNHYHIWETKPLSYL
jgi:hypothetical protein